MYSPLSVRYGTIEMTAIVVIIRHNLGNSFFFLPMLKAEVELLPAHACQFDVMWVALLPGTVFMGTFCPKTIPANIKK